MLVGLYRDGRGICAEGSSPEDALKNSIWGSWAKLPHMSMKIVKKTRNGRRENVIILSPRGVGRRWGEINLPPFEFSYKILSR